MTYLVAEAGTGHAGDNPAERFHRAGALIAAAASTGFDAVKFQLFVPDEPLFCPLPGDDARWTRWNRTLISLDNWMMLQDAKIDVLWSAFQPTGVEWLKALMPRYIKVASRAAHCYPYGLFDPPFIVSTGLFGGSAIPAHAFKLKCITEYPAPLEKSGWDANYNGLSDHSGTIYPGLDAIAHDAKFLEVHFRLPFQEKSPDDPASLSLEDLKTLSKARDAFARMHPGGRGRSRIGGTADIRRVAAD